MTTTVLIDLLTLQKLIKCLQKSYTAMHIDGIGIVPDEDESFTKHDYIQPSELKVLATKWNCFIDSFTWNELKDIDFDQYYGRK